MATRRPDRDAIGRKLAITSKVVGTAFDAALATQGGSVGQLAAC